jgi:hypothetical protein
VDGDIVAALETVSKRRRQVAVEFDAVKFPRSLCKWLRDGSVARADFDDGVAGLRVDCPHDRIDDAGVA